MEAEYAADASSTRATSPTTSATSPPQSLAHLPDELLLHILSYLTHDTPLPPPVHRPAAPPGAHPPQQPLALALPLGAALAGGTDASAHLRNPHVARCPRAGPEPDQDQAESSAAVAAECVDVGGEGRAAEGSDVSGAELDRDEAAGGEGAGERCVEALGGGVEAEGG
ncbi:hypothetical protein BP5796_03913 [Coleophoma crateriformis]|uniref:F-box domain-containing protein n=1 Tax=Coleophoma crateriformis TaxID=565419 RepID=A0A3D8SIH3_9HELO|nr:hypothetical protein BP5796_03913 [Coleophoma crateriformis]